MKILIIKASALGDILHCFPVVHDILLRHPDATIDWVVEDAFADLLAAHPHVSRVHRLKSGAWRRGLLRKAVRCEIHDFLQTLRQEHYDLVIDLQGNIKSGLVTALCRGRDKVGFGRKSVAEWPNILATRRHYDPPKGHNVRDDYAYIIRQHLALPDNGIVESCLLRLSETQQQRLRAVSETLPHRNLVMVCPGARWPNKQLTAPQWKPFLQKIQQREKTSFLFLWGSGEEKTMCETIQEGLSGCVLDKMPLPVVQHLMSRVSFVLAMDSLPLHLAATANVPTFSVFGASSMQKYRPPGIHGGIQGPCPYGCTFDKRCRRLRTCKTGLCIRGIPDAELYAAFTQWRDTIR